MEPIDTDDAAIPEDRPPFKLSIAVLYALILVVGLIWCRLGSHRLIVPRAIGDRSLDLAIALAAGLAVVLAVALIARWTALLEPIEAELASRIGPLTRREVWTISTYASLVEEVFFRGAFLPSAARALGSPVAGLVITSLVFGVLHKGPNRRFLPWTLFATLAGGLLGWLYLRTGDIVAPTFLHFVITVANMSRIARRARAPSAAS